jgi:hypothetical protein
MQKRDLLYQCNALVVFSNSGSLKLRERLEIVLQPELKILVVGPKLFQCRVVQFSVPK